MALTKLANFVQETASSPGTGTVALGGAATGRRTFAQAFSSGASVFYFIDSGTSYECGIGTFTSGTPNHLARTTVLETSAGGTSPINFTGTVRVYCEVPASYDVIATDFSLTGAGSGVYLQMPAANPATTVRCLIQAGGGTTAAGVATIAFPLTFPNVCTSVVACVNGLTSSIPIIGVSSVVAASFHVTCLAGYGATLAGTVAFNFLAFGY